MLSSMGSSWGDSDEVVNSSTVVDHAFYEDDESRQFELINLLESLVRIKTDRKQNKNQKSI